MVLKIFRNSNEDAQHQEVVNDLLKELSLVRGEVYLEYLHLKGGISNTNPPPPPPRGRLLSLFIKDLAQGVSGSVLSNKARRDSQFSTRSRKIVDGVSAWVKWVSWIFVFLMNMGMLLYVYLFAMTQTHSRQSAWFQSFVIWLVFEIFVSSTGLVLFVHLLIPLFVLTDISRVKAKVLSDLTSYRQSYLRGGGAQGTGGRGKEKRVDTFNAAKYLFPSWRVASLCPELPESGFILKFSTPWPTKKFGNAQGKVANEYDQAVILTALSRVVIFFLAPLLHLHVLVQDILVQTLCNSGFGYLFVWSLQLFHIHPLLSLTPVVVVTLSLSLLLRRWGSMGEMDWKKFETVHPIAAPSEGEGEGEAEAEDKIGPDQLERGESGQRQSDEEPAAVVVSNQSEQGGDDDSSSGRENIWEDYLPHEDLWELEFGQDYRGGDRDEGREDELMSPEDVSSSSSEEMIFIRILPRNTRF
jgi:hypothetical protein